MLAHCSKSMMVPVPVPESGIPASWTANPRRSSAMWNPNPQRRTAELHFVASKLRIKALAGNINNAAGDGGSGKNAAASSPPPSSSSNTNYVVPLDNYSSSSCITRPLAEILRDLNKRIPDNIIIKTNDGFDHSSTFIPWYHANRMLSFYAPGWCGEIRDVIYSDNGNVTVVYRVTIRGSDGEAHRESTGTVSSGNGNVTDLVAAAEEIAFCRACARFGLGLYLYHEG